MTKRPQLEPIKPTTNQQDAMTARPPSREEKKMAQDLGIIEEKKMAQELGIQTLNLLFRDYGKPPIA